MDGRQKYMMFKEIVEHAVNSGGTVFGCYVRDFIQHEDAAKRFYENHTSEQYSDPTVSPDTLDRLLIPSDIDVKFETVKDYNNFRNLLRNSYYNTQVMELSNLYTSSTSVHMKRMQVSLGITCGKILSAMSIAYGRMTSESMARQVIVPELVKRLEGITIPSSVVKLDILLSTSNPPFNKLDFECNGLVMDKDGIHLCDDLKGCLNAFGIHRVYNRIIDDIKQKRAVLVNLYPNRWDKMVNKGWTLVGGNVEKVAKDGEMCLICHEDIKMDDAYKLKCCKNVHYHFECLSKQITYKSTGIADSQRCPHCRQGIYLTEDEISTFGAIVEPRQVHFI